MSKIIINIGVSGWVVWSRIEIVHDIV